MEERIRYPWQDDGEVLVLESPEQTAVEYRVASFGSRLLAALIDKVLIVAIVAAIWILAFLAAGVLGLRSLGFLVAAALVLHFLISLLFYVWAELRWDGRTPGKRRLQLQAVLETGRGITLGASLIRNLARVVDEIPIAWIVVALNRGNRRIGDLLAGTYVISERAPTTAGKRHDWLGRLAPSYRALEDRRFYFAGEASRNLYPDDLDLLEYLGARLARKRPSQRRSLLEEVASKYVERLELRDDRARVLEDPERFLQELGLYLRDKFEERLPT